MPRKAIMIAADSKLNGLAGTDVVRAGQRKTVNTTEALVQGTKAALELSDEQLAQAAAAQDARALEELFRRYEPPVVRYLQRLTHDADAADDLFQDSFLRAYANLGRYDARRPFRPWLYRIATNVALDWLRRRTRAEAAQVPPPGEPSVDSEVVERALARRVEAAVAALSVDHRTVFVLRHYQGLDYAEIAQICGSPEGTVRSRMHYAIRALRGKLSFLVEEGEACD